MVQDLFRCQSLARVHPQEAPNEAFGFGGEVLGQGVAPPPDLAEQAAGLGVVEGVTANQHRVQHHPEGPAVGGAARVVAGRAEDLRADVGRAAVLVVQPVVVFFQYDSVV